MSTDNATKPVTKDPEERGVLVNDPEIKALAMVDKILASLPPDVAMRVAAYAERKFSQLYYNLGAKEAQARTDRMCA